MAFETIKVRKKNNHGITRTIQPNALKVFEKRGWEVVPGESFTSSSGGTVSLSVDGKKKDVEPAEVREIESETGGLSVTPIINHPEDDSQGNIFVTVGDAEKTVDQLREDFQTISGKPADKRWNQKRLTEEIAKLTPAE